MADMRYTEIQRLRKQASDAIYERSIMPNEPYRPNPPTGPGYVPSSPEHYNIDPRSNWLYNKARDLYGYYSDFRDVWPEVKKYPWDAVKSTIKGTSARTADAVQGLYSTVVNAPARAGSWYGDHVNSLISRGLHTIPGQFWGNVAKRYDQYRRGYNEAIPETAKQIQAPMEATVHALDKKVQNSQLLKERALSGKGQEAMRRLGGVVGTLGETALWGASLGGLNGLKAIAAHPFTAFGSDLAFQYGLGNRQSESLASGAAHTYWQQANEKADQIAKETMEQEYAQNGTPDLNTLIRDRQQAKELAESAAPFIYSDYLQGEQYK